MTNKNSLFGGPKIAKMELCVKKDIGDVRQIISFYMECIKI